MGEQTCPSCGRDWWSLGLPSFKVIQWCETCKAEKRRRMDWASEMGRREREARMQGHEIAIAKLTSEEREARAEKDSKLWG